MYIKAGTAEGDAHHTYCNGTRIATAIEADTEKGYVIAIDRDKGKWNDKYGTYVRRYTGKVELVHIFTGVVIQ